MTTKETGGPAFANLTVKDGMINLSSQMTLRDYFAAKAMQGFISSANWATQSLSSIATDSYDAADAMLEARNG